MNSRFLSEEIRSEDLVAEKERHERSTCIVLQGHRIWFCFLQSPFWSLPSRSTMQHRVQHEATHTEIYIPMQWRDKIRRCTTRRSLILCFDTYFEFHTYIHRLSIDSYVVKLTLLIHMETPYNMIKVLAVIPVSRSLIQRCYKLLAGN